MENELLISGLQHFSFCRRQWALIHIEGEWSDNYFTVDGHILHENADDPFFTEKRGNVIISRALDVIRHCRQVRRGRISLFRRRSKARGQGRTVAAYSCRIQARSEQGY